MVSQDLAAGRDWRDRAVCRGEDPELFFPVGSVGPALAQIAAAKSVCAGCPVCSECLAFALEAIPEGVAGGLTGDERRALREQRTRTPGPGVAVRWRRAGRSARWIAARLGVTERTVHRWLAVDGRGSRAGGVVA